MKGFISKISVSAVFILTVGASLAVERVGEVANYNLDRSRQRTTSMIKRGTVHTEVLEYLANDPEGPSYNVGLDYNMRISFVGKKQGSLVLKAPEEFFTPEFMVRLRAEGEIHTPKFKIKHMGFGDAKIQSGRSYANCDKVLIYDVDTTMPSAFNLIGLAQSVLHEAAKVKFGPLVTQIENMTIKAYVTEGIPVIGAVKIDMTGKANGYGFKAGFDYVPQ